MSLIRQTTITAAKYILLALALAVPPAMSGNGQSQSAASAAGTIVDTLGAATPATKFSVFGSGGQAILADQFVGPEFTITEPTRIGEIGGFVNNCGSIVNKCASMSVAPSLCRSNPPSQDGGS